MLPTTQLEKAVFLEIFFGFNTLPGGRDVSSYKQKKTIFNDPFYQGGGSALI
jgi:hypothetical protein